MDWSWVMFEQYLYCWAASSGGSLTGDSAEIWAVSSRRAPLTGGQSPGLLSTLHCSLNVRLCPSPQSTPDLRSHSSPIRPQLEHRVDQINECQWTKYNVTDSGPKICKLTWRQHNRQFISKYIPFYFLCPGLIRRGCSLEHKNYI